MILNLPRTRGCATSQTTLLAIALLTFMGAGVVWSTSGKSAKALPPQKAPVAAPGMRQNKPQNDRPQMASSAPATLQARSLVATAKLPIAFEPNQGQADSAVSYLAHGAGYGLFLTPRDAVLTLNGNSLNGNSKAKASAAIAMRLEGASAKPSITAAEPLPGKTNYLRGNDRSRWVRNVPTFARVQYSAVYPGIDLVYYGKQGQLEYDFSVHPGANPRDIRFKVAGADRVSVATDGSLRLSTPVREVRWNKPVVYQEVDGQRQEVSGRFQLLAKNRVGFALGQYDRSRDLIIDPLLSYATYFGGTGSELNPQVAVDVNSNVYISGTTSSATGFPACVTTPTFTCPTTPPVPTLEGLTDVFVSKLDPSASQVIYTTYLNGLSLTPPVGFGKATGADSSAGLAVDNQGNAYITGTTTSSDFPVTTNARQSAPLAAGAHVFLTKLDSTGAIPLYSTYLSGLNTDNAMALAADNSGNAYILGWTQSVADNDFLAMHAGNSFQPRAVPATRVYFVARFDTTQTVADSTLKFFSFLGGTTGNGIIATDGVVCAQLPCGGIALDSTGNIYVAVGTTFTDLPPTNSFQSSNHGRSDVFAAKITNDGAAYLYSTYLGGLGDDVANAVALDSSGDLYITGSTTSSDFPAGTTNVLAFGGGQDAFLAKLNNPSNTPPVTPVSLTFRAYIGGSLTDTGNGVTVDANGNAYVVGSTNSSNFPAPKGTLAAKGLDAFLVEFNTPATALLSFVSSNLLGGALTERATSIAKNPNGGLVVAGETNSTDFPVGTKLGVAVLQPTLNGTGSGSNTDAFLADFGPSTDLTLSVTPSPNPVAIGSVATFTYAVLNKGPDASTGAVLSIPIPQSSTGETAGAFATSSGSCAPSGTTEICTLGTITANSSASVTVGITPTVVASTGMIPTAVSMSGSVAAGNTAFDPNPGDNFVNAKTDPVASFTSRVSPPAQTVKAGQTVGGGSNGTVTVTLTPNSTAGFPSNISLSCVNPTTPVALAGTACTFTPNPVPPIAKGVGAVTATLKITTTAPTATASLQGAPRIWYALWLPLCGMALFGVGSSRRRRWMTGAALILVLGTLIYLPACGKKSTAATTTGTQPGTYIIAIRATSGTFTTPATANPLTFSLTVTP